LAEQNGRINDLDQSFREVIMNFLQYFFIY